MPDVITVLRDGVVTTQVAGADVLLPMAVAAATAASADLAAAAAASAAQAAAQYQEMLDIQALGDDAAAIAARAAKDQNGADFADPSAVASNIGGTATGIAVFKAASAAAARDAIKVGDTGVDVKARYGLTALNDSADQAKIETALSDLPVASKVYFPQGAGAYKLTETLNITRAMDFENELNATFRLDVPATDTTSPVLSININEMPDQINVPGASVRGMVLSGGRVFSFDTTASTANTSGSYGLAVNNDPAGLLYSGNLDGTYYTQIGLRIVNMALGGRLGGLLFAGTGAAGEDSVFFSGPEFCTIENGFTMEHVPDGQRALFCQSLGTNPAFTLNAIGGAYNHTFQGGTTANRDGLAHVINGDRFLFDNIQVEHGIQYLTPSQNHKSSYLYIEGQDRVSIGGRIKGNNFGSTTYNDNIIVLGDTDNVLVDENYLGLTEDYDIFFDSAGTTNFIWGPSNVFRGARSRQTVAAYKVTDASRLLKVGFDTGVGPYNLKGLYNLWINAADVFPSGGGFGLNGLEFMVTRTGQVYFQGQLSGAVDVNLPADTTLLTAPDWVRPVSTQKMVVIINDTPHVLTVLSTGDIYSETGFTAPAGTALSLYMNSAFYHAIINVPYEDGVE